MKSKTLRVAMSALGVALIVWGLTGANSAARADDSELAQTAKAMGARLAAAAGDARRAEAGSPDTSAQAAEDLDGDGVGNELDLDINDNDVADDEDPTIATFVTADDLLVSFGIAEPFSEELRNVSHDAETKAVGAVSLPWGFLSYDVINVDEYVPMIMVWEKNGSAATDLYKGTTGAVNEHPVEEYIENEGAKAWGYYLDDGAAGDADGVVNGTIVDPIGPGIMTTPETTTSTSTPTSTSTTFITATTSPVTSTTVPTSGGVNDPDNDGVSNEPAVDLFELGVNADQDPTVAFIATGADEGVLLAIDGDTGQQLRNVTWSNPNKIGNVVLPSGVVSFNVVNASGPVDVLVVFPDKSASARKLFKGVGTMVPFATDEAEFEEGTAAFAYTLTDGGNGDADGVVNGTIVDPVGPGFVEGATTVSRSALPRTGTGAAMPAAGGLAAIALGALLLGFTWRPQGAHYLAR